MTKARRKPHVPDPWADIPVDNRPTVERMGRGRIEVINIKENGVGRLVGKAAFDRECDPTESAFVSGKLSARRYDAARRFEALARVVYGSPSSRSCLNMEPVGGGDISDSMAEMLALKGRELRNVQFSMSAEAAQVLYSVAVRHEPTGQRSDDRKRWRLLCIALDIAADFWRIPHDEPAIG